MPALPGSGAGGSALDTPPPSPDTPGGGLGGSQTSGGAGSMPTLSGLSQPAQISSAQMPPEVLTGIMQAAEKITSMFDSFAQVTPDLAGDWAMLSDMLKRTLGKLLVAGGGPTSPQATGSPFPGGGMSQGQP